MSATKICRDCNQPLTEENHRRKDGRRCTPCYRKYARDRKRAQYHNNPDLRAYHVAHSQNARADPDKREAAKMAREKPEVVSKRNQRRKERYDMEPKFRMLYVLRGRIQAALEGKAKAESTDALLGISRDQFVKWIEYQFEDGMTWDNHGTYWHIDHVQPCASFDLNDEKQQKVCFSWKNQQPLRAEANLSKSDTVSVELIAEHALKVAEYEVKYALDKLNI